MSLLGKVIDAVVGDGGGDATAAVRGTVVLMKKNVLDFNDFNASIIDNLHDLLGRRVSLQLITTTGELGKWAYLEDWISTGTSLTTGESSYRVTFEWEQGFGIPGALLIKNNHHNEFYLKTVTLEDPPDSHGKIHFICNSWVYPAKRYNKDRVFFSNKTYLPHEMPMSLRKYREEELVALRGDGTGELKEWDRVYDYAYYNDLGDPDKDSDHVRPVLGGSDEYPYPRRARTGRPPTNSDPNTESRLQLLSSLDIYVPRDERFGHLKMSDFLAYALKAAAQYLQPQLEIIFDKTPKEFDSFEDYLQIYLGGIHIPLVDNILGNIPSELLKEILNTDGAGLLKYPMPEVIKEDKSAWRTDEEFAREMLAGVNPVIIKLLKDFPPRSTLDSKQYGNQHSSITKSHIENNLDGLTVEEALRTNRLFILDHHDALIPYLRTINANTSTRTYATRTILLLKNDDTLKPLAIELSLPHPNGDGLGAVSKVYTPAMEGVEGSIWELAKAYACVNDSGYHQLISHFLNTHAVAEPFIIASNRQLSVVHPIYKLLHPHFRDTLNINAFARQILINAGGILEFTVFPGKYAMEMSSVIYKNWVFLDQALPRDLKLRGVAVDDPESNHGLRLLIKDYPYAVDGLEIWSAIHKWVEDYCSFYYKTDEMVQQDPELQSWWKEIREEGHGDKRHEQHEWPKMQTVHDLIETCTILIWICSALHAAVNFGQYPYAGYMPNRPTLSRRFMPEEGSPEYSELEANFEKAYLKTITDMKQTLAGISIIEILSRHASDEVYLGKRDTAEWTTDAAALAAFEGFGKRLSEIEEEISERNRDERLKNRVGQVKIPYTLLFPTGEQGIGGKGIPNSVSI